MTPEEIRALQLSLDGPSATGRRSSRLPAQPPAPPPGMDPSFYTAMVSAGAAPHAPQPTTLRGPSDADDMVIRPNGVTLRDIRTLSFEDLIAKEHGIRPAVGSSAAPQPSAPSPSIPPLGPPQPVSLPQPPASAAPILPSIPAKIEQLPQQVPVMSQVSPAPKAPAVANIDNNVAMPQPTFTPAQQRPSLPTFLNAGITPNLGAYGPAPSMPGYGMPRQGSPFKAPSGLPTFAAFGGSYLPPSLSPQPYGQPQPDMGLNIADQRRNLFNMYQ